MTRKARPDERNVNGFTSGWAGALDSSGGVLEEGYLSESDPRLGLVIAQVVACSGRRRYQASSAFSDFDAIVRSIVYQQLSKQAAATIYARYLDILGGDPSPERVLETSGEALGSAGISAPKVRYLKALASAATSGELDLDRLCDHPDEFIIRQLTGVPGVGVWTAQMFLMFRLRRPDVLPTLDVGIQRGLLIAHGLRRPAAPGYVARAGRKWAPYRSLACLYLWSAVDQGIRRSPAPLKPAGDPTSNDCQIASPSSPAATTG